jgi:uncharacterized membrane protein YdjX (TVP38/TMEM64 family)
MNNRSLFKRSVLAALVVVLLVFGDYFQPLAYYLQPEGFKTILETSGSFAPLVLAIFMALAVMIPFFPTLAPEIAAGAFFGPVEGTVYCAAGAVGGAVAAFLISRYHGREFIVRFLSGHINFCPECSDRLLTKVVFASRLLPIVSFPIVSYGAGLTKMSVAAYSLATLAGMLPITFIDNYFGSAILSASRGTAVVLGVLTVSSFFLLPILIERYDLFSMRRYFQHENEDYRIVSEGDGAEPEKNFSRAEKEL